MTTPQLPIDIDAFTAAERTALLRVLVWLAGRDGDYGTTEQSVIHAIIERLGMSHQEIQQAHLEASAALSVEEVVADLENSPMGHALIDMMMRVMFSDGDYDARERSAARSVARAMGIDAGGFTNIETEFIRNLLLEIEPKPGGLARRKSSKGKRVALILGAAAVGGLVLFVSGGAAAPAIGGLIGAKALGLTGAAASSAGLAAIGGGALSAGGLGVAGGTTIVASVFGVTGGAVAAHKMARRTAGLQEFNIEDLVEGGTSVVLGISGFLSQYSDFKQDWAPLKTVFPGQAVKALRWESKALIDLGKVFFDVGLKVGAAIVAKNIALAATRMAGRMLFWPAALLSAMNVIDNPWSIARMRAELAGEELANVLHSRPWGRRPVTLVGFSLGTRVIVHALARLASEDISSRVESVVLLGGAVNSDAPELDRISNAVSGPIVNGYCDHDMVLRYLYRSTEYATAIGLGPLRRPGITDVDLSDLVSGHTDYRQNLGRVLERVKHRVESV
jgi:tellurite resistance protein